MKLWRISLLGAGLSAMAFGAEGLDKERAAGFVQLALKGIDREYPNKPGETLRDAKDIMSLSAMHPAFYGNFDWHSCVHGHWLVVRLLRLVPDLPRAAETRAIIGRHLTA